MTTPPLSTADAFAHKSAHYPHETWLEDNRYLNMTFLAEQKKELLRLAA